MLNALDLQAVAALEAIKAGVETGSPDSLCQALNVNPSASHAYIHDSITGTLNAAEATALQVDESFRLALSMEAAADAGERLFEAQRSAFTTVLGTQTAAAVLGFETAPFMAFSTTFGTAAWVRYEQTLGNMDRVLADVIRAPAWQFAEMILGTWREHQGRDIRARQTIH